MTNPRPPIPAPSDDLLHAFVDGRLPADEAKRVQAWLNDDREAAATVAAWSAQRAALQEHLKATLDEPLPASMLAAANGLTNRRRAVDSWTRWGGRAAAVLLAFVAGWAGHAQWQSASPLADARSPQRFARQALAAHAVYLPETRHPVEVEAAQQEHLVQWLSKRLGRPLRVPQLGGEGFELVGGRLLPAEAGARAQFMFQNGQGERLTLYIGAVAEKSSGSGETAFRFTREGPAASFYWVDQGFGYALAGNLPRERLLALADTVYRQLAGSAR